MSATERVYDLDGPAFQRDLPGFRALEARPVWWDTAS
jgi:hypothetical protein